MDPSYWGCCLGFLTFLDIPPAGSWTHEMWLMPIRYRRAPLLCHVFDLWPPWPSPGHCWVIDFASRDSPFQPPKHLTTQLHPPKFGQVNLPSSTCWHEFNVAATSCSFSLIIHTLKFALIIVTEFSSREISHPKKKNTNGRDFARSAKLHTNNYSNAAGLKNFNNYRTHALNTLFHELCWQIIVRAIK